MQSIVKTALDDLQHALFDAVDQSMFPVDATRPEAAQISLQWLRLADAGERMPLNIVEQRIDLVSDAQIRSRPIEIIVPSSACPDKLQRSSLRALPLPAFSSRTARARRAAFFGLESR